MIFTLKTRYLGSAIIVYPNIIRMVRCGRSVRSEDFPSNLRVCRLFFCPQASFCTCGFILPAPSTAPADRLFQSAGGQVIEPSVASVESQDRGGVLGDADLERSEDQKADRLP